MTTRLAAWLLVLCLVAPAAAADAPEMDGAGFRDYVAQRHGRPLVVNLWATWCAPCIKELPGLATVRRTVPDEQLDMIGVSFDFDPGELAAFLDANPLNYPVFLASPDLMETLGVTSIPLTMLFDTNGLQVMRHEGYIAPDALCAHLRAHASHITDCGEK
ncbi:MAG: TlpA family protein disulfide reductase [Desulfovibrionaceae bacterium]